MARRQSAFREVGLSEVGDDLTEGSRRRTRPQNVRFRSEDEVHVLDTQDKDTAVNEELKLQDTGSHPSQNRPVSTSRIRSKMYQFAAALIFLGALISCLQSFGIIGKHVAVPIQGVSGGTIPQEARSIREVKVEKRDSSRTSWCFKWAQQSTIVNGTLYLYGGQVATEPDQVVTLENTWTDDFITLDLTQTWQTGGPPFQSLAQPSDVPPVSLGYLWNSYDSLFLYGGEYSWKPPVEPAPFSTWEYKISSNEWVEHSNPVTSKGLSAPDGGIPVQRAAEGAGVNVPNLGRGFYFGGHLDTYTTPGWDISIARVYLQALLEFTFPGYSNVNVDSLGGSTVAGDGGVYRNITEGGVASDYGFTARADGILTFVPGFGDEGILIALAGGVNDTFTQMNVINVYDIATSSWYNQATSGTYPDVRVNPCSVVAAAPDGSSYNIYMFGGQNLIPYGSQTQKDDMWILSVPSFVWIKVDQSGQSVPPGRSGATCNIWNGQMVMVGGYLGNNPLTCEYPGTFVFNLSSLIWQNQYTALSSNSDYFGTTNDLSQQPYQLLGSGDAGGLEGSYGYTVPSSVQKEIGGNSFGGATLTKPVVSATGGPMKTGSPIIYTTQTTVPNASGGGNTRIVAIVVGVVCGLALLFICYLLFSLFLYRKQLALYKRHVEMSQAQARGEKPPEIPGLWTSDSAQYDSDQSRVVPSVRDTGSHIGSNERSQGGTGTPRGSALAAQSASHSARRSSEASTSDDLLGDHEPTFVGVILNPRRSLKVINRD